jgi:hypothetical protein
VYHPPPPGQGKNAKHTQVDSDVPAEQVATTSVVVDGQMPTTVVDATSDSRAIVSCHSSPPL